MTIDPVSFNAALTPYEHGWQDAERGRRIGQCPYPYKSGFAVWWRKGWLAFYRQFQVD